MLAPRPGQAPCPGPPVRIFLGTEPRQQRAERVFLWSIERVRNPARTYEIYLMRDIAGFDRRRWLTGFTGYRFAIPHWAGASGRAIYNDVDQVYLSDPGELFDLDMGDHGFLTVPPLAPDASPDTSVMLIDCARMASVWTLEAAQREPKKRLLERAARPGLRGDLSPDWNACDEEYAADRSRLLHFTTIHTQPWQPFPERYAYQPNPVAHVFLDLERSADAAGYEIFGPESPSAAYRDLLELLRSGGSPAWSRRPRPLDSEAAGDLRSLAARRDAATLLDFRLGKDPAADRLLSAAGVEASADVVRFDPSAEEYAKPPAERCDGVLAAGSLDRAPDEDVPWLVEQLFRHARRFVWAAVTDGSLATPAADGRLARHPLRTASWWTDRFQAAAARHPEIRWAISLRTRRRGRRVTRVREAGEPSGAAPVVWILTDGKPGHTTQSIGLAEALGWPYQVKELRFGRPSPWRRRALRWLGLVGADRMGLDRARSAALAPPWPDLVIATGWRPAPVARWIGEQSRGRTRLVLAGRVGGYRAEPFDAVVTCAHFHCPPHPRRIETTAPLCRVSAERFAAARARWPDLLSDTPRPRVVLLVGGSSRRYRLDAETARRMGNEVRRFAEGAGGSAHAVTSRRTGEAASAALEEALGGPDRVHRWRSDERENPYLAYLASADVLVVTGESESMLAEAAGAEQPLYVYPLPERQPGGSERLQEWILALARSRPRSRRGRVRPQQGLERLCARLVERGVVRPRRDLEALHRELYRRGAARPFGDPLVIERRAPLQEGPEVARRLRGLLGWGRG